jgi:hypothetical protein
LAKKVALALTSDLFDMLLLLLCGTKSDFLDFVGKATPAPRDKTAKLTKSSETTVQKKKKSLRRQNHSSCQHPRNFLRGTNDVQPCETVQKDCTNEGTSPDPDGVKYARPLKVTKAGRF